jgi:hypothetical protein
VIGGVEHAKLKVEWWPATTAQQHSGKGTPLHSRGLSFGKIAGQLHIANISASRLIAADG